MYIMTDDGIDTEQYIGSKKIPWHMAIPSRSVSSMSMDVTENEVHMTSIKVLPVGMCGSGVVFKPTYVTPISRAALDNENLALAVETALSKSGFDPSSTVRHVVELFCVHVEHIKNLMPGQHIVAADQQVADEALTPGLQELHVQMVPRLQAYLAARISTANVYTALSKVIMGQVAVKAVLDVKKANHELIVYQAQVEDLHAELQALTEEAIRREDAQVPVQEATEARIAAADEQIAAAHAEVHRLQEEVQRLRALGAGQVQVSGQEDLQAQVRALQGANADLQRQLADSRAENATLFQRFGNIIAMHMEMAKCIIRWSRAGLKGAQVAEAVKAGWLAAVGCTKRSGSGSSIKMTMMQGLHNKFKVLFDARADRSDWTPLERETGRLVSAAADLDEAYAAIAAIPP